MQEGPLAPEVRVGVPVRHRHSRETRPRPGLELEPSPSQSAGRRGQAFPPIRIELSRINAEDRSCYVAWHPHARTHERTYIRVSTYVLVGPSVRTCGSQRVIESEPDLVSELINSLEQPHNTCLHACRRGEEFDRQKGKFEIVIAKRSGEKRANFSHFFFLSFLFTLLHSCLCELRKIYDIRFVLPIYVCGKSNIHPHTPNAK